MKHLKKENKIWIGIAVLILAALVILGIRKRHSLTAAVFQWIHKPDIREEIGLKVDEITIDLEGVTSEHTFVFISDMHIVNVNEEVAENWTETATVRRDIMFVTSETGMHSADTWERLSGILDDYEAEAVLLGGDMIDFMSEQNVKSLKNGLDKIKTPVMYLRADHDLGTWYSNVLYDEDARAMSGEITEWEDVYLLEYEEFIIAGWNNSTSQMTEEGYKKMMEAWNTGKPIILVTHVPLDSMVDTGLHDASAAFDPEGRAKLWGVNCLYYPNDYTMDFLNHIYGEDNHVKAVLCGHLHFKYTAQITEDTTEYVFAPAFAGNIARVTVK